MKVGCYLSDALVDEPRQQMITMMRLYEDGKAAFYSKMVGKVRKGSAVSL
jgi:hypothetical protein